MKKVHKSIFFVVLALVLAFVCVTILGAYTTYGDITTTVIRGYKELTYDRSLDDSGYFVLKSKAEISEQDLLKSQKVIEQRLLLLGYQQFNVIANAEAGSLYVSIPWKEASASTLGSLASSIMKQGIFEVRAGSEADSDGNPTGVSETVILNNDAIKSVKMNTVQNSLYSYYGVTVTLNKAGKATLAEATQKLVDEGTTTISYWLNGTKIGSKTVSAALTTGTIDINDTTQSSYSNSIERLVFIRAGVVPAEFTVVETVVNPNTAASGQQSSLLIALLAIVLLAGLLFIVIFKMSGVTAAVALLLQAGAAVALQTGIFTDQQNHPLTFASLAAILSVIFFSVAVYAVACAKVSAGVGQKLSPAKAVLGALNGSSARGMFAYVAVFVLVLCGYLLSTPTAFYGSSIYAYLPEMNEFFRVAMVNLAAAFGSMLVFRLILKSVSSGNWRSGKAFASIFAKGSESKPVSGRPLLVAVALVLVVSVALAFVLPGASSHEKDGMTVYSVKYSKEDVDSAALTPALLALDSNLDVQYGYTTNGTSYAVTVTIPVGSSVTTEAVKAEMDKLYADTFTETINLKVGGAYTKPVLRNMAIIAAFAVVAFGAAVSLFASRFRRGGILAALSTVVGSAVVISLLYVCGLGFGHAFVAAALAALLFAAAVSAIVVFEIDAAKNAKLSVSEAVAVSLGSSFGGYASALFILLLAMAVAVVLAVALKSVAVMGLFIGLLAVAVLALVYCAIMVFAASSVSSRK